MGSKSFNKIKSMIKTDFRRMFTMPLIYIMIGISLVIPILIFVMTTMMAGTESVDQITGEVTIMEQAFTHVWQAFGSMSTVTPTGEIDMLAMCNIDMMFFAIIVLVSIFVSEDFRSGYSKALFTVRANKTEYVISKTLVCSFGSALLLLAYTIGAFIGGAIANLSFEMIGFEISNVVFCILSKIFLTLVFVPIVLIISVSAKDKLWISMIGGFGASMLLFMMISAISPLTSTIINVIGSLIGGIIFSIGLGLISKTILSKTSLV